MPPISPCKLNAYEDFLFLAWSRNCTERPKLRCRHEPNRLDNFLQAAHLTLGAEFAVDQLVLDQAEDRVWSDSLGAVQSDKFDRECAADNVRAGFF